MATWPWRSSARASISHGWVWRRLIGELGRVAGGGLDGGGEGAAGGDFGELVVVADEDHLGAGVAGGGDHTVQVDGAGHPGFVDRPRHGGRSGLSATCIMNRGNV